jgi:hypothetical protein
LGRVVLGVLGREVKPEAVTEALARLEASIDPTVAYLKEHAPPQHLDQSRPEIGLFIHHIPRPEFTPVPNTPLGGSLRVKENVGKGDHVALFRDRPPNPDEPRGRVVNAGPPRAFRLKDTPLGWERRATYVTHELLFMPDGQVCFSVNEAMWDWEDIKRLSPRDAMQLVGGVLAGVEAHRANP